MPLVILHGLLGSSRNWNMAGRALTEKFAVYVLDQRNHGDSPHEDEHTYKSMVADLKRWMEDHGLKKIALMGHSMGGKVGMLFACRYPERVDQLYIADISPREYHPQYDAYLKAMRAIDLESLNDRKAAELQLEAAVESWGMRQFLLTNLVRDADTGKFRWQVNIPALLRGMSDLTGNPLKPDDRYPGPVLFLKGGNSPFIEMEDRKLIRYHFPHAHLVVLKDVGHNVHVEARETFVESVLKARDYFAKQAGSPESGESQD